MTLKQYQQEMGFGLANTDDKLRLNLLLLLMVKGIIMMAVGGDLLNVKVKRHNVVSQR